MRRVNEAVREVLSEAIATELKDPRVGFVTVTAVDTSPGSAPCARFRERARRRRSSARDSLAGLASSHGYLQSRVASKLRMKHTPTARVPVRRRAPSAVMRITELLREDGADP